MSRDEARRLRIGERFRVGAIAALAIAVAFIVWLVVRGDGEGSSTAGTTTAADARSLVVPATPQRLRVLARAVGHPVYWAGGRRGVKYELTQTPDGRIYIRYLPPKVPIGDRRGSYLIVGTYPVEDAFSAVESAAAENGSHRITLARDGLAVYNDSAPTNVYFAYPSTRFQVEVFHPDAAVARRLVTTGRIAPIR